MTHDFERVRQTARSSAIAGAARRLITAVTVAWSTSSVGGWVRTASAGFARATPAARLRWWAITVAVAAATHLVLRSLMSSTVAPAMPPGIYILIAAAGAVVAWQAEGFHRAWHGSRLSRLNDRN